MIEIGTYNILKVNRAVDFGFYLTDGHEEVLLPKKWIPEGADIGKNVEVFIYTDSEDRLIATTMKPKAILGDFAALEVTSTTGFGAFLDWGLEKDLLLPKNEQIKPVAVGEKAVVKVCLDFKTNRLIGVSKIGSFLKPVPESLQPGQQVEVWVYNQTPLGYQVMVNEQFAGLLYENEVFEELQVGDKRTAWVKKRREDDKLDVSLKPFGKEGMKSDREKVLEALKEAGGTLALGDKSEPEEISRKMNMSKKAFKRATGMLYKEQLITLSDYEVQLKH